MTDLVRLLDVSGFQPPLDWKRAKEDGFEGVWIRAAHGNDKNAPGKGIGPDGTDLMFRKHVVGAMGAGLAVGMYAVAFPLPHLNPRDQADWFFERSDTLGAAERELPPMLDLEWPPREMPGQKPRAEWRRWGCSGGQIVAWAVTCLDQMEHRWKRKPGLYTYPWFWRSVLEDADVDPAHVALLRQYVPWIAGGPFYERATRVWIPTSADVARHLPKLAPWNHETQWIWQHDGTGGLSVGHADVDCNVTTRETFDSLLR